LNQPQFTSSLGKRLRDVIGSRKSYKRVPDAKRPTRKKNKTLAQRVADLPVSAISEVVEATKARTRRDVEAAIEALEAVTKEAGVKDEQDLSPKRNEPFYTTPTGGNPARPSNANLMKYIEKVDRYSSGMPVGFHKISEWIEEAQIKLALRQIEQDQLIENGKLAAESADIKGMYQRLLERRGEDEHGNLTHYPGAGKDAPPGVQQAIERFHKLPEEEQRETPLLYYLLGSGTPNYKMSKELATYKKEPRGEQKCGSCKFAFQKVVSGKYICSQVRGEIQPEHWCRLWRGSEQGKTAGEEREPLVDHHDSAPENKLRPRSEMILFNTGGVYAIDKGDYLLFPGGGVDDGEQPRDAAIRETIEESNRHPINVYNAGTVEAVWPKDSGNEFWDNSDFDGERTYFFFGVDAGEAGITHDDQEDFELMPFDKVLSRLKELIDREDQGWAKRNNEERRQLVANAKRLAKVKSSLKPVKQAGSAYGEQVRHDDYETDYSSGQRGTWTDQINTDIHAVATEKPKTAPGSARTADGLTSAHKVEQKHTQVGDIEDAGKFKHASEELLSELSRAVKLADTYTEHAMEPPIEVLQRVELAYNKYAAAKQAQSAAFAPPPPPPEGADQPPADQAGMPAQQPPAQGGQQVPLPSQQRLEEGDPEFVAQNFVRQLMQGQQGQQATGQPPMAQHAAPPQMPSQPLQQPQPGMQVTAAEIPDQTIGTGAADDDEIATIPDTEDEEEILAELDNGAQNPALPVKTEAPGTAMNQPAPGVIGPTENEQQQLAANAGAATKTGLDYSAILKRAALIPSPGQLDPDLGGNTHLRSRDSSQDVQSEVFDDTPEATEQIEFAQQQPVQATLDQKDRASTGGVDQHKTADVAQFKPLQQHILLTPEGKVVVRRLPQRRFALPTEGPGKPAPYESEIPFVPESGIPDEGFHGYRVGLRVGETPQVPEGFEAVDPTEALTDFYASMGLATNKPYRQLDRARARALVRYLKRKKKEQEDAVRAPVDAA